MKLGYLAFAAIGLILGIGLTLLTLRGDDGAPPAPQIASPAAATTAPNAVRGGRVVANVAGVTNGGRERLLKLRELGGFTAACEDARLNVAFKPVEETTVYAIVDDKTAAVQTWQVSRHVSDEVHVANVTFATTPLIGGDGACLVSVQAVVQQRPRQNSIGVGD
jgi:hypothetical protein